MSSEGLASAAAACIQEVNRLRSAGSMDDAVQRCESGVEELLAGLKLVPSAETAKVQNIKALASSMLNELEQLKIEQEVGQTVKPRMPISALVGTSGTAAHLGHNRNSTANRAAQQDEMLDQDEKEVLYKSSYVEGKAYLPWVESDSTENHNGFKLYNDPDGNLPLSEKQMQNFGEWKRPAQLVQGKSESPRVVVQISAWSVTQRLVPNCSFVSSLCCCAAYEQWFGRRIITSRIFPQNSSGVPVVNPAGRYAVRLHFNGVERKVVVDDKLPCDARGRLICAHSSVSGEFWVSLVEKAFLKVHGGYDFSGSNSEVDMYMLTGWIPEAIYVHDNQKNASQGDAPTSVRHFAREFDKDKIWDRIRDGFHLGQCLVSASTGALTEAEQENMGLVDRHAYAVLQVHEAFGHRLLLVKNPWSERRWKGPFSPQDTAHWTPELQAKLGYDIHKAKWHDNGVFWIEWDSLLYYFAKLHFNWNPYLFRAPRSLHFSWQLMPGQARKFALMCDNRRSDDAAFIWLHLNKHVLNPKCENKDYIALHVFKNNIGGTNAISSSTSKLAPATELQYYMEEATIKGVYINNPHVFIRLDIPAKSQRKFTLVLSQQDRTGSNAFTIRAYGTVELHLRKISNNFPFECHPLQGAWPAGGEGKPVMVNVKVEKATTIRVRLESPKEIGYWHGKHYQTAPPVTGDQQGSQQHMPPVGLESGSPVLSP